MKHYYAPSLFFLVLLFSVWSCDTFKHSPGPKNDQTIEAVSKAYSSAKDKSKGYNQRHLAIDTVISLSHKKSIDSTFLDALSYKATLFNRQKKRNEAIKQAQEMLKASEELKDSINIAKAYFKMGYYHYKANDLLKAFGFYDQSKKVSIKIKDSAEVCGKLLNMADIQKDLGDLKGSEATAIEALNYFSFQTKEKFKVGLYNLLASSSQEQKNYKEAFYWYEKALGVTEDPDLRVKLQGNLVLTLNKQGQYKTAKVSAENLKDAAIFKDPKLVNTKLRNDHNLGVALSHLSDPKGERLLLSTLSERILVNDRAGQFSSHIGLADHFERNGNNAKALSHANKGYDIAVAFNSADAKLEALGYIVRLKLNPKEEAIAYQRINDSLQTAQRNAQSQFAKIKYDSAKNREDNLALKAETVEQELALSKASNRNLWIGGVGIVLFGLAIFYFRVTSEKHKRKEVEIAYDTETKISKKVHDELANDVYTLMTRLQINKSLKRTDKDNYLDSLEKVYQKTRDISRETGDVDTVNFSEELRGLVRSFNSESQKVLTKDLDDKIWTGVSHYKKVTIYRVLQELLTNFKKHSNGSAATLVFQETSKKTNISYTDNGIGIPDYKMINKNGLQNVENRMDAIKGDFTFEKKSSRGLAITLGIPK